MNNDRLKYADLVELLINGPVGGRRRWAAVLVLRMLETRGACGYRSDGRLGGAVHAQIAMASLQAGARVLSASEQGLLLRTILTLPWEQLRRGTGLGLRVPEIFAELGRDLGLPPCLTAAQSVIEHGEDAVRQYPLDGLLPEVRRPGEGLVIAFDAWKNRPLDVPIGPIEIDRLAIAVQSFRGGEWQANLRPLVAWWLESLDRSEADRAARGLFRDIREAFHDEHARWRALGLLDWLADHPDHPTAGEATAVAREVARADVRKATADLAAARGQWEVLEGLAQNDRDRGVRQRAEKLLTSRKESERPGNTDSLSG
ncbi:MAG TPA: hypothetical protein P5555_18355 [Candidatus Paceibacterota bacterium]|nr:hypothetical protein [Verrucomicrobiota bacterium]HOX04224.1 hypothetical protein [Verrucomicrobiota bacterium]HRZ47146.1 hypothetical protein [Candidatus Paceibacterota bacterium]